jgi:hypothetical protein
MLGIEAISVDMIVDETRVRVVDSATGRVLHSVRLVTTESVSSLTGR